MNKTITVNLGGTVFHIEEAAYQALKQYIDAIEQRFGKGDSGKEILNDIEARMSELLQPRLNEGKQAILPEDVTFVMSQLGKPEDFGEGQPTEPNNNTYNNYNIPPDGLKRRLFRNPNDRTIAGVCSGISAYFGWDPVWMRIAFAACVLFGFGSGLILYIVLWIALPVAHTPIEKIQMRGEDVTLKNIEDTIKKEAQAVGDSIKRTANNMRVNDFFHDFFHVVGQIIKWFFLSNLIFIAFMLFICTTAFLFGNVHMGGHRLHLLQHFPSVLPAGKVWVLKIGCALVGFAPAVVILIWALKSIFKWHLNTGLVALSGFIIFGAGIITLLSVGKSISEKFDERATIRHTQVNYLSNKQLVVRMNGGADDLDYADNNLSFFGADFHIRTLYGDDTFILKNVEFTIETSDNDSLQITTAASSWGSNYNEAHNLAGGISYTYTLTDSVLTLPRSIDINKQTPWRNQNVEVIIKVPVNARVALQKNTKGYLSEEVLISDNSYSIDKLSGHHFIESSNGLQCIDCTDKDKRNYDKDDDDDGQHTHNKYYKRHQNITIEAPGIEVKTNDDMPHHIKVSKDSVSIKQLAK